MSMLRNLREKKGLVVSQLAAKAGISSRVILDYEEGRQTISLNHAKLLAKALWVGIEELMPPAGSIPPQSASIPQASPRPTPAPLPQSQTPTASLATPPPAYRPSPDTASQPRYDAPRTVRAASGGDSQASGSGIGTATRGPRPTRPAPPPPGPITEGQMEELQRLATKLEITQEQLEQRVGKALAELNRPEAKDWIKRARGMVEEIAPSRKAPYGQWPDSREDQEATYLKSQQEAGSYFIFKLFNGDQFDGVISDFTPYTITIKLHGSNDEMVLRKLAVAYYRQTQAPAAPSSTAKSAKPAARSKSAKAQATKEPPAHDHAADDKHQPLDKGVDSDRTGEPVTPEADSMDEDRGM